MWEVIFLLVVLKIPLIYCSWVIWWAIKSEPELELGGDADRNDWKVWRSPSGPRPRRGGPHGRGDRAAAARRRRPRTPS
jgi:hypothetical protein